MSFVYEDFGALTSLNDPREFGDGESNGYYGPVTVLDDVDGDGIRDVLMGNAGTFTSGRSTGYLRGAAVLSGATGALIRSHNEVGAYTDGYGWTVQNVNDVDGDGVSDYSVGRTSPLNPSERREFLYSGWSGTLIREYAASGLVAMGDLDNDGQADLFALLIGEPRGVVYSGISDTVIREFSLGMNPRNRSLAGVLGGGIDLNTDGTPDAVLYLSVDMGAGNIDRRLIAFSGADASVLWEQVNPSGPGLFYNSGEYGRVSVIADLTGDGVVDLAATNADHLLILSGVDGTIARDWTVPVGGTLGKDIALYGDLDQDAVADLVVGASSLGNGGRVLVVSGADGSVLSSLGFLNDPPPNFGPYGTFGDHVAVADLDGDGSSDILAIYQRFGSFGLGGFSRSYVFDGTRLAPTVVAGTGSGPVSRSIVWGQASSRGFIVRDSVVEYLTDYSLWNVGEVVIDVYESADEIVILGAAAANGHLPFVWIADHHLMNVRRMEIVRPFPIGGPPNPPMIEDFGVAVAGHQVLFNRVINSTVTSAYLFDADTEQYTMLLEGAVSVDVGIDEAGVVTALIGRERTSPPQTIIWRGGMITELPGRPVSLSPLAHFAVNVLVDGIGLVNLLVTGEPFTVVAIPRLNSGEDFGPVGVNDFGDITGTYIVTASGQRSGFYYAGIIQQMFDLRTGEIFGDPAALASTSLTKVMAPTNASDVLMSWGGRFSLLTLADPQFIGGPNRVGADATIAVAFTPSGSVYVITANAAGETLHLVRAANGWTGQDLNNDYGFGAAFRLPASKFVTWYDADDSNPTIALLRPEGLLLLEPTGNPNVWIIRNLTQEIGAEAIIDGLITFVPPSGLRIVAGLNAEGELVLYGQTVRSRPDGSQEWAFDNLYDSVVYPTGTPPPAFRQYTGVANLVGYVTGWGGQNIAGLAGGGQIVVFWTAPGLNGWRITNLAQVSDGDGSATSAFGSLHVTLTPWNGINLYGENATGNRVNAAWWVPQFGGRWRSEYLISDVPNSALYPRNTLTAYATPWGGLNVARIDPNGQIEVYWWSPAADQWTREVLNPQTDSHLRHFHAVGRLSSAVSNEGELNIFARNELGDIMRFFWDPQHPWQLERV